MVNDTHTRRRRLTESTCNCHNCCSCFRCHRHRKKTL